MSEKTMNKPIEVLLTNLGDLFKVKTIVTLTMIGTLSYGFVNNMISPEAYIGLVGVIITFYFTKKTTPSD